MVRPGPVLLGDPGAAVAGPLSGSLEGAATNVQMCFKLSRAIGVRGGGQIASLPPLEAIF